MNSHAGDLRVVALAPTGRDSRLLSDVLKKVDVECVTCPDGMSVCEEIQRGCGLLFLTEEAMTDANRVLFKNALDQQPHWSDLPIIICTSASGELGKRSLLQSVERFGNVTLLERPVRVTSLLSAVYTGLRARRRHYAVRDYILEGQRLTEQLEDASRRKDEFVAMLGHELRNPLAAITSALSLMEAAENDLHVIQDARRIAQRQTTKVSRLVDDLLDISRLLRNRIELKREPLDARQLLQSAVETLRSQIQLREHKLCVKLPDHAIMISGDQTRLCQVLENVLENACKYTHVGGHLRAGLQEVDGYAVFSIRDNGAGIPADLTPHIFDLFSQGGRTLDRSQGGLGIGLTVVKQIVELHDGQVVALSDGPGKGSEFIISLPVATDCSSSTAQSSINWHRSSKTLRVMVVDDNHDLAMMTGKLIEMLGHRVCVAHDGESALGAAMTFRPNVVLLDIGLPHMDGYVVVRKLRELGVLEDALIVAVTGYGQTDDQERARAAGFDAHYVKPISVTDLQGLLARAENIVSI